MTCLSQYELTYSLHSSLSCTIDLYIFFSIFPFKRRWTACTHLHGCSGKGLTLEWLFLYFQRLHKSFKENQYPDRTTKESLAQELGLTYQQVISFSFSLSVNTFYFSRDFLNLPFFFTQVAKWFGNTRWSFRHSSQMETNSGRNASQQVTDGRAENEGEKECELISPEFSGEKSKTPNSRKRKHLSEPLSEAQLDINGSAASSPNVHLTQIGNKMKTRKRKWYFMQEPCLTFS